jgi:uncharacterized protein YerC
MSKTVRDKVALLKRKADSHKRLAEAGELLLSGESYRATKAATGVSMDRLRREFPGYGNTLKRSQFTEAERMLKEGYSYRAASRESGVSQATLRNRYPNMGQTRNKIGVLLEKRLKEMLEEGMSYAEVGRTMDLDPRTIQRAIPGYKWTRQQAGEYAVLVKKERELSMV